MRWSRLLLLLLTGCAVLGNSLAAGDEAVKAAQPPAPPNVVIQGQGSVAVAAVPPPISDEQTLRAADVPLTDQGLLEFFRKRTLADADQSKLNAWIEQLGDDSFEVRERASAALAAFGGGAERALQKALKSEDVEILRRAEECLRLIKRGHGAAVPAAAARMIAKRKTAGAVEVLLAYVPFAENDTVTDEIRIALIALAVRDGKPDPSLSAALKDKIDKRRAVAAEALVAATADQRPAVRNLLKDQSDLVRLRVALALAKTADREAIPVLIDLLARLPANQGWQAEDVLFALAGDNAPQVPLGHDQFSKKKCCEAWTAWWKTEGPKIDLARLHASPPLLGYTLILQLDVGEAFELDVNNKQLWKISGLQFPLDAQMLPKNRVLFAEHHGNKITERNFKGEILWEKRIENPLMAQRLPNGNTFIATSNELIEVDAKDKTVWQYQLQSDQVMKAQKLRNGDLAFITQGGRFVRMDEQKKELLSFPCAVKTSGGRVDVLSNGRVLVPEADNNRVVEYDREGKPIWEISFESPINAVRLPSGNTMVTFMSQKRAVEVDRTGKVVWEFASNTRVNRAFRR